jgi:polysaccharide export outer membrane protein
VINVPDRSANKVFVIGEVRAPHSKLMTRGRMTLAEALTDPIGPAGGGGTINGFDPAASNVSKIYVIRGAYEAPNIYHLDASSADALLLATQFPLEPRDIVFVSTYELARFNRVLSQILPTINALWQVYDVVNRER